MPKQEPKLVYQWKSPLEDEAVPFNTDIDEYDNEDPDWHWDNDKVDELLEDNYLVWRNPLTADRAHTKKDTLYVKHAVLCNGQTVVQVLWPEIRIVFYGDGGGAYFMHYYDANLDQFMKDIRKILIRYEKKRENWQPPVFEVKGGEWDDADAYPASDSFVKHLTPHIKYANGEWRFKRIPAIKAGGKDSK